MNWQDKLSEVRQRIQREDRAKMLALKRQLTPHHSPAEATQIVVNGKISRDPINRQAAMITAKETCWLHHPPDERENKTKSDGADNDAARKAQSKSADQNLIRRKKKRQNKGRSKQTGNHKINMAETHAQMGADQQGRSTEWTSDAGLKVKVVGGQEMIDTQSVREFLMAEVPKLVREVNPMVEKAKETRRIMDELLKGIGGDAQKFMHTTKMFLEDIRQTRYSLVAETAQMTKALTEVRQFFMGSEYREEIKRLSDFVDLCERLNALKNSGFLDRIADTMLELSIGKQQI